MLFRNSKSLIKNSPLLELLFCYRKQILLLFLSGLFSCGFSLIAPYLSKLFIDDAFIKKDLVKFLWLSFWGVVIFLASTLLKILEDTVQNKASIKLKLNLANRFIRKIYSFDFSFFQSKSVGENVYRLSDVDAPSGFIIKQCPSFLVDLFKLPVILGISLMINLPMTVFLLALSPLFIIHSLYLQKKLNPIYQELWQYGAKLSQKIHEAFANILIIKAFGLETYQRHSYLKSLIENIRWQIKSFRWFIISSLSSSFLSKAIYGAVTLYGGWLIIKGSLTIGSYTAVMLYLMQLGSLLESLSHRFEHFAQESVSLEKFFEVMNSRPEIKDLPGAQNLKSAKGIIQFKNVCFGYQPDKPIFNELNLQILPHSWIGIVGLSGCGKTSLINLMIRIYEPWEGEIFLDGMNLKTIRLNSLKKNIAIATQQPFLFDVSLRQNISYGLKNLNQEEIGEAGRIAQLDDYIKTLPLGYDTLMGEDACRLSHGLKQRVAIARAMARRPDLLILDEATSSVDSFTEEKIFQALRQKRQGLSTIIISHRLSSIKDADRIYFLKGDSVIEEGTHPELIAKSQAYQDFFKNQRVV